MPAPLSAQPAVHIHPPSSREVPTVSPVPEPKKEGGFGRELAEAIARVDANLKAADAGTADYLSGRTGIHEMAIALEKADLSLRLMTRVRNRIIEAYKDISRM